MKRNVVKHEVIDTSVTIDEVFAYIKKQIKEGKLKNFEDSIDEELFELAKGLRPIIEIELECANRLALEQLQLGFRKKSDVDYL
jgi:hypothetical protein